MMEKDTRISYEDARLLLRKWMDEHTPLLGVLTSSNRAGRFRIHVSCLIKSLEPMLEARNADCDTDFLLCDWEAISEYHYVELREEADAFKDSVVADFMRWRSNLALVLNQTTIVLLSDLTVDNQ